MPSPYRSSLVNNAVFRLTPEVFSHPVWLRFGKKEFSASLNTVDDLLSVVKNLEKDDPGTACQVLLICAVYQNDAGQRFNAIRTTQQALALSRSNNLVKELTWSLWGTCAILIQDGDHEQACAYLVDLQAILSEQNEWVLANFVDMVRQAFSQPDAVRSGKYSQSAPDPSFQETIGFTFDWLLHWGFTAQSFAADFDTPALLPLDHGVRHSEVSQSFFSIQHLQGRWHTFMLAIRGELSLQWKANELPSTRRGVSFWGTVLSSVRFYLAGRRNNTPPADPIPQTDDIVLLPPAKEKQPSKTGPRRKKATVAASKAVKKRSPDKGTTLIPVAVHMLGTFSMTIGDLTIKLPASRGLSLLKYLLAHRKKHITREALMDIFWPDSEPQTARNSLDVALHSLRKALRKSTFMPVILYQDGGYSFEPCLQIWLDVDEFESCVQTGQRLEAQNQITSALAEYEAAVSLYQGDFLEQNPYEEWTIADRERFRIAFLDTLDRLSHIYFSQGNYGMCILLCQRILTRDNCSENAHRRLMRCYSRQGQQHLALRQYLVCADAIRKELDIDPETSTIELYERIRHGHLV